MRIEEKTGWFTKNARLFELCGKMTWAKPPIAVLRTARSDNYFPYTASADDWDIGRSSLQAAHFQNVYVSEAEVQAGLADAYPVIFDAGTQVLDDTLLAALDRYVRGGGTFIATNVTGRHTSLDADAWPIEKLSGFKVLGERENMHVTVVPDNPLLRHMGGMTFNGNGIAVNWMGVNHLAEGAVALEPKDGDGVALAHWEDGTVAAGMRRLGKGRVIILASSFWRSMSDRAGNGVSLNGTVQTTFLSDLFTGLGLTRQADIDSEDVWVRRLITKNGLQDWVMAWNSGRGTAKDLTLTFPLAARPARVVDLVSGQDAAFTYQDGSVRVPIAEFPANEFRAFAVDRPGLLDAVDHWFAVKRKYETRVVVAKPSAPPLPPSGSVVMDSFKFRQADARAKDDLSWLTEPTDAAPWKDVSYGFWDEMGYAAKGIGLYRRTFRVPATWSGHRVLLCFAIPGPTSTSSTRRPSSNPATTLSAFSSKPPRAAAVTSVRWSLSRWRISRTPSTSPPAGSSFPTTANSPRPPSPSRPTAAILRPRSPSQPPTRTATSSSSSRSRTSGSTRWSSMAAPSPTTSSSTPTATSCRSTSIR
jgi:hypothetical protein